MNLLKNEDDFFVWISEDLHGWWDVPLATLRQHGPNTYPCFGFIARSQDTCDEPGYLYAADLELMTSELRKAEE